MSGVAACADLADGVRVPGAQARIAADPAAATRSPQPSFGALGDQRPLKLGDGTQDLQRGVVVSIGSRRLRKCVPLASSCSFEQVTDRPG